MLIHARSYLANPLTVVELAEVAALSPRQFSRAFCAETGQSPTDQRYVALRLDCTQDEGRARVNLIRTTIAASRLGCRQQIAILTITSNRAAAARDDIPPLIATTSRYCRHVTALSALVPAS